MGIFGQSTPFDADIEKATSETNTNENWSLILDVCDKVSSNPRNAKECLKAIMKRMGHADPHVVMQAITLLDACCNNCGKSFHLEVASREFETEYRRLLSKAQPKVSLKMRQVIKSWAENDFKNDPELNLIPSLYNKLRLEGFDFSNLNEKPPKSAAKIAALKDPNVVNSQQEEDDIAKAIELSLKEAKNSPKNQGGSAGVGAATGGIIASSSTPYPQLYPSFSGSGSGSLGSITSTGGVSNNSTNSQPEPRKVRALYDFEAAEENELTFFAGEIIHVVDDSDPNWWKGFNQRGDGLFPSNFVTADLSVDPERLDINQQNKTKKTVQFEDDARELELKTEAAAAAAANQRIEIDEAKIDRLLHLLHEANPEDPSQDSDEMLRLEQEVHQMGPLIDAELERVDRKHAQLTQLSSDLVDAINLYHSLMRDDRAGLTGNFMGGMPGMAFQGATQNQQMLYGGIPYNPGSVSGVFPTVQNQQLPQNYGMPSLPYASNVGQLPSTTASSGAQSLPTALSTNAPGMNYANNQMPLGGIAVQSQMGIPIQYQNGHVNSPQMNGALNPLSHQMSSPMATGGGQQHLYGTSQQPGQTGHPSQQIQSGQQQTLLQQNQQNYQMLPQQQQQQELPQQQYATQPATTANSMPPALANNTPQQQFMSPQHQQQQHQSHGPAYIQQQMLPPPQQQPQLPQQLPQQQQQQHQQQQQYTTLPNGPQAFGQPMLMQQPSLNNHNNNNNPEHFSQLQQQMAAMAMGINQPVTQNFLVQNEPKNSIPIYQQQR